MPYKIRCTAKQGNVLYVEQEIVDKEIFKNAWITHSI